jgi:hypothetical protein
MQHEDNFSEETSWRVATRMNMKEMENQCTPIWNIESANVN